MPKKQKDNRYRAKITVGYDGDGVAQYKYVSARTKKELEDAKVAARAHYIDGAMQQRDALFSDYAKTWYRVKKEPFITDATRGNYEACLNKHLIPAFGDRNLRAIQSVELQEWLNRYEGVGNTTIVLLLSILKKLFATAMAEGFVQVDVAASLVKPRPKPALARRALTDEERLRVLQTISRHKDGLFLAILYYLGVRRGEALGLLWGDILFSEGLVHIQRDVDYSTGNGRLDNLKTKNSDRYITIPSQLLPLLVNRRGADDAYLFPSQTGGILSLSSYRRMWLRLMIDAELATPIEPKEEEKEPEGEVGEEKPKKQDDILRRWDIEITPHYFRHNYITMLYDAGIDMPTAMKLVGHGDIKTTINIYTHLKEKHLQKAKQKIDHVFEKLPESCQNDQPIKIYKKKNR